jgi:hypothetical protein
MYYVKYIKGVHIMKKTVIMFVVLVMGFAFTIPASASGTAISAPASPATAAQSLTSEESNGLVYMFEEEKLARDVYNALFALWGQPIFQTIAASEQTHMNAVQTLLVRYGIAVPQNAAGIFSNSTLQALYTDLMTNGEKSLADALKVGATIEEVDITDLQSHLAQTTNTAIQTVYNNLMNGSYNHLRNFVKVLNRLTGEVYQPQYLSADLYQSIITGTNGKRPTTGNSQGTPTIIPGNGAGTCTTTNGMGSGKAFHGGK